MDTDWLIFICGESPPDSDPKHPDFVPPGETRVAAVNVVENRHKFLQPTVKKYATADVCSFKAKDRNVVGLFRDGVIVVWDLVSNLILYQFQAYQVNPR